MAETSSFWTRTRSEHSALTLVRQNRNCSTQCAGLTAGTLPSPSCTKTLTALRVASSWALRLLLRSPTRKLRDGVRFASPKNFRSLPTRTVSGALLLDEELLKAVCPEFCT